MSAAVKLHMYVQICTCMYKYVHVCTYMYMYVHVCTYMYKYVHVCTYLLMDECFLLAAVIIFTAVIFLSVCLPKKDG